MDRPPLLSSARRRATFTTTTTTTTTTAATTTAATTDPGPDPRHFALQPVSGATLYALEVERRGKRGKGREGGGSGGGRRRGRGRVFATGCREIDGEVLGAAGGWERGSVVGVSAEEGEVGVLIGLQTIAHSLVFATAQSEGTSSKSPPPPPPRAAIITTLPATAILPLLRDVIRAQVRRKLGSSSSGATAANQQGSRPAVDAEVRRCLEQISVSRVFDIEGLWEVLSELEEAASPPEDDASTNVVGDVDDDSARGNSVEVSRGEGSDEENGEGAPHESSQRSKSPPAPTRLPPLRIPAQTGTRRQTEEVLDSEDEEELSSPSPVSPPPPPKIPNSPRPAPTLPTQCASEGPSPASAAANSEPARHRSDLPSRMPDIIVITHFSALLTALFTQRDSKSAAHSSLQLLSSHLRYLARSQGPLIMLLNSTKPHYAAAANTTSASTSIAATTTTNTTTSVSNNAAAPPPPPPENQNYHYRQPLDATLRSIFNPPPPHPTAASGAPAAAAAAEALSRRNKPAFGATFAQFADLHVLCARAPRSRADADMMFATTTNNTYGAGMGRRGRYAWVVEVLLDELGLWEEEEGGEDEEGSGGGGVGKNGGMMMGGHHRYRRVNREQRWGAVEVRDGVMVVDAFLKD